MVTKAKIGILGAGLMGHGIAQVFICAGHRVKVHDAVQSSLETLKLRISSNLSELGLATDCLELVSGHSDLREAVGDADVVFEAAPEKLDLKREIFGRLIEIAPRETLFASNTSVIPITQIADGLKSTERILGTHWWNPPFLVPLVEVVGTSTTSRAALNAIVELLAFVGKTPVLVRKDVPGFIGNRLQHALWREAIALVEQGVCDAETVDTVVKASFGRRLAVLGPLENADLIGTDLTLDIHNTIIQALDRSAEPSPHLTDLVTSGRLGSKTGRGFRIWRDGEADALRTKVFSYLKSMKSADDLHASLG